MSETINISGDTFEVDLTGQCDAGDWRMVDADNRNLLLLFLKSVGKERLEEVMSDEYKEYEWGSYYARGNQCVLYSVKRSFNSRI